MNKFTLIVFAAALCVSCQSTPQKESIFSKKYDKEISALVKQMSVEEKVHQMATQYPNANMRLGIPNICANECLHGIRVDSATVFPQAIAMASTWEPDLIQEMGDVVGRESRALGVHQCYTPMLAVVRDARWGRTEESFGEDPYLVGTIGTAYIKGMQGVGEERFDKNHIIATAKHFVADGEPMAGDNGAAHDLSDYTLYNIHLYPFRMAIEEGRVGSIMPAHHYLNGIPCHANTYIMNDILRDEWGWDGLVVADNGDIRALNTCFNHATDPYMAAKQSLEVGVHQELAISQSWSDVRMYGDYLIEAVDKGIVDEKLLDEAVSKVLEAKFEIGVFDKDVTVDDRFDVIKYPANGEVRAMSQHEAEMYQKAAYYGTPRDNYRDVLSNKAHDELALKIAERSMILLKNENNVLPIDFKKYKNIAVIGPNGDAMRLGGYSPNNPKYFVSILDGMKSAAAGKSNISYAQGCDFNDTTDGIKGAAALAKKSDLVILAIGGSEETCKENQDIDDLHLPKNQQILEEAIKASGTPYVVVLLNGRPMSIEYAAENADAIIEAWYLGQETGNAVANVLTGEYNPSGKLPMTFARNAGQMPAFYYKLETGRPRDLYKSDPTPLYPFGFGLSYTTFEVSAPTLTKSSVKNGENTTLQVEIKNTGDRFGEEVLQLYVHDVVSKRGRPEKELRSYKKVGLNPGESKIVDFEITPKVLEYWVDGAWVVEDGEFELKIGTSSDDLQAVSLMVK